MTSTGLPRRCAFHPGPGALRAVAGLLVLFTAAAAFAHPPSEARVKTFARSVYDADAGTELLPDDIYQSDLQWLWTGPAPGEMLRQFAAWPEYPGGWGVITAPAQRAWAWSLAGQPLEYSSFWPTGQPILPGQNETAVAWAAASVAQHSDRGGPTGAANASYEYTLVLVPPRNAAVGPVTLDVRFVQRLALDAFYSMSPDAIGGLVGGGRFLVDPVKADGDRFEYEWLAAAYTERDGLGVPVLTFEDKELVPSSVVDDSGQFSGRIGSMMTTPRGRTWFVTHQLALTPGTDAAGVIDPSSLVLKTTVLTAAGAFMNPYGSEPVSEFEDMTGAIYGGAESWIDFGIKSSPGEGLWTLALVSAPVRVRVLHASVTSPVVGTAFKLTAYDDSWTVTQDTLGGVWNPPILAENPFGYPRHPVSRCRFYLDRNNDAQIDPGDEQVAVASDGDLWNGGSTGVWTAWATPRADWGSSFRIIAVFENALGEHGTPLGRVFQMGDGGGGGGGGGGGSSTLAAEFGPVTNREVRLASARDGALTAVTRSDAAAPIVMRRSAGGSEWRAYDLRDAFSISQSASDLVTWVDPATQHAWVMCIFDSTTCIVSLADDTFLDQSQVAAGASRIVSHPTVLISVTGDVFLAGLNDQQELVLFSHAAGDPPGNWGYANLSRDHLEAQGLATPGFRGALVAYASSWGGLNLAGLDDAGQIQVVWWAPGLDLWTTSNLSAITGAPPIAGSLSVYTTPWGAVNLAGAEQSGKVFVTWWVPQFGADWVTSNLSDLFDGPPLRPDTVSSYVTPWGGTNIVGADDDGKVVTYWWAPGQEQWSVAPLTDLIPGAESPGDAPMFGDTSPVGEMSLISSNRDGRIFRYYLAPSSTWKSENLSDSALVDP